MERKINAAMMHLDQKLIFIPLVFILLRFWGTLRFFISFAPSCHSPCEENVIVREPCKSLLYDPFLMVMQAICDPGQGWGNALIFVVFHKTILKRLCPCAFFLGRKLKQCYSSSGSVFKEHRSNSPSVNDPFKYRDPLLPAEDPEDGHHTPIPSDESENRYRQTQHSKARSATSTRM